MEYGLNNLWPTTVLLDKMGHQELVDEVCQTLFSDTELIPKSSDFQSYDILRDGGEIFTKFKQQVVEPMFDSYLVATTGKSIKDFKPYKFRSWIAGSSQGYMIPTHNHSGASVSAVFYLLCEEKDFGGQIKLMDPRANANRGYQQPFKHWFKEEELTPSTGDAILFPSYVYHYTLPFLGKMRLAMPVDFYQE
jgi:hypothetical protein